MSPSHCLLEKIKNEEGQRVREDAHEKAEAEINGRRNHLRYYLSLTIDATLTDMNPFLELTRFNVSYKNSKFIN